MRHARLHLITLWAVACLLSIAGCEPDDGSGAPDDPPIAEPEPAPEPEPEPQPEPEPAPQPEPEWTPTKMPCGAFGELVEGCPLEGWFDRDFAVYVPRGHDPTTPTAVVMAFHGGGGGASAGARMTCPGGDPTHPACLHQIAEQQGFAVVYGSGTSFDNPESHTWNSGGREEDGWQCVGGPACRVGIDDIAYTADLLAEVNTWIHVDPNAVFATGLSNGGAMAHRLACELGEVFAAIAPVGASNQFATGDPCEPAEPVAVLHIHGDSDLCWTYETSDMTCAPGVYLNKVGVDESMAGWVERNNCAPEPTITPEEDADGDGVRSVEHTWSGCDAAVVHLQIEGGGHTYPNGRQYFPAERIGPTLREWGSERIWAFFDAHRRSAE